MQAEAASIFPAGGGSTNGPPNYPRNVAALQKSQGENGGVIGYVIDAVKKNVVDPVVNTAHQAHDLFRVKYTPDGLERVLKSALGEER